MVDLALRAQFHRARALWLGLALTRDLAWSLALLLASALLSFHLDRRFVLSPQIRMAWGLGTLALAGAIATGRGWWSFRRRPDDRAVAMGMERRHPALRERLLSAVELGRLPDVERAQYSAALLAAVQVEAEQAARGLDFRGAIPWYDSTPALATCILLAALMALHTALAPAAMAAWWGRMLNPGADIPVYRETRVRVSPREALLLRGGDLSIAVTTEGRATDRADLHFRIGGSPWTQVALRPPFRHRIQGLTETTQFYATAGDGQSDQGIARVVDPPTVVGLRLRYHFPDYMALPDQAVAGVSGALSVPAGTRVELAMTTSKPLRSASLENGLRPAPTPLRVGGEEATGALTLWSDTSLRVHLWDTDGFAGLMPHALDLHAVSDQAPEVQMEQPLGDQDVVADASVPLHVAATDDHGLHHLGLAYSPEAPDSARPPAEAAGSSRPAPHASRLPLAEGSRTRRGLDVRARWNLAGLSLHPGDTVVYRAEADDFDNLRGPHIGQTPEQRLRIVDRAEMAHRLAEGWADWDRQLAAVIKEQADTRAAVRSAQTPAALAEAERRQRDLAPRADDLSRRAGELAEMARTNHLAAEATITRQEHAGTELADIARRAMPNAADRIREGAAQPARRADAMAQQAEIGRRLEALRRWAQLEMDLEALARRAEELARAQVELQSQSQRLLPATLGMNVGELGTVQRVSLERMSRSQSSLQETTGQFEGTLDHVARTGQEPAIAASHLMRERTVPERQGQAARHVAGNILARAAAAQQAVAADLRQVAALLRRRPEATSQAATAAQRQAMARTLRQLQQMLAQHSEVMRRTAARPSAAESRRLARQERALREQAARMAEQLRRSGMPSPSLRSAQQRMAQAERQLNQGAPQRAQSPQQQAQEAMRRMAEQLQNPPGDRQADAQRELLRRDLADLAQRQGQIGQALQQPDKPGSDHSRAAQLAPRQEGVERSARKLESKLPSETFRSTMAQAEQQMQRSGKALQKGDTGSEPRSSSQKAERLLRQMARALEDQSAQTPPQGGVQGRTPNSRQQNAQELARRLADLRLLRALEQGLREDTGEADGQPQGREQRLQDLARRQAQTRRSTSRLSESMRRMPGVGARVGAAAGAMGEAQRGLQGGSAGADTQGAEGTAVMRLTQAIGQGQQQLQAMARPGAGQPGGNNPSQPDAGRRGGQRPALDSLDVHGSDEGGPRALVPSGRRGFGLLSPGDQQALRQGGREKVPADYADLVRRYYRALSERAR